MASTSAVVILLLGVGVALFCSLDQFESQRNLVWNQVPKCVKEFLADFMPVKTKETSKDAKISKENKADREKIFTKEELKLYDGTEGSKGLYLAIMGKVYDVSGGESHYGQGSGYHFFTGKDGSKAFVTGEFNEKGLTDDIDSLGPQEMLGLVEWVKFYDKTYKYIGKLEGYFYDENGVPREGFQKAEEKIKKGLEEKAATAADEKIFPPCNSEWSMKAGGRVYCSKQSGGIERDWVGVPRKYFRPGSREPRYACVRTTGPPSDDPKSTSNRGDLDNPNLRPYPGCDEYAVSCNLPKD